MSKVSEFKLNKLNAFIFNMMSILIFIVGLLLNGFTPDRLFNLAKKHMLLSLSIPLIIVFAHETMHAFAYKLFGAKLKLGYKHFSIYLTDVSGNLFTLKQMAIIMLFPLFFISVMLFIAASIFTNYKSFILLAILINLAGSIGDILLLAFMVFKGKACWVKDEHNGFSLYKTNVSGS